MSSHKFNLDGLDEFATWNQLVKPQLQAAPNVLAICEYGFTEVLNNVIDHAGADEVAVRVEPDAETVKIEIEDDGVGVFARLRAHFAFDSDLHALIELVKGKLTVAPEAHTGEGLFFSSKMFDTFTIESNSLAVSFTENHCDVSNIPVRRGTLIRMKIAADSQRTSKEVFDRFCGGENYAFYKTRFYLSLAALEGNLVSRSQAKRVASRFDSFGEVELDFAGIASIGQGFADELLRVWPLTHPQTQITLVNAGASVKNMLSHVQSRKDLPQGSGPQNPT